jgi:hypothetical protein
VKKLYALSLLAFSSFSLSAQSGSQSFTASGMFIVPAGVTTITVELVGAGGAGGGNGGGGGGGGGYASGIYSVTPGDSIYIDVGTAGGGPNGGAANIAQLGITAYGGDNGTSVSNPNIGGGGVGGNANGGNIANNTGGDGGGGYWTYFGGGGGGAAGPAGNGVAGGNTIAWSGICQTPGGAYGPGGGSPGGDGGKGAGFTDVNCNMTDPAGNGLNYGGGGGGGNGNGGIPGSGANGYCIITWGPTSVTAATLSAEISVSPNPFTNKIQVLNANGNETYELLTTTGQSVWNGQNIQLQDFSFLAPGIYLLHVRSEEGNLTEKVVKQ